MEEIMNKELEKYYNLISNELDKLEKINKEKYDFTHVILADNSIDLIKIYINIFLKTKKLNRCLTFQEKEIFVFFTSKYASYDFYRNNRVLPRISDCLVELLEKVEKIYSEVCDIEN